MNQFISAETGWSAGESDGGPWLGSWEVAPTRLDCFCCSAIFSPDCGTERCAGITSLVSRLMPAEGAPRLGILGKKLELASRSWG